MIISRGLDGNAGNFSIMTDLGGGGIGESVLIIIFALEKCQIRYMRFKLTNRRKKKVLFLFSNIIRILL